MGNGGTRGASHIVILLTLLRPKSDLNQISHCNIKCLSVTEITTIENMISQVKYLLIFRDSPHYLCKKCMETYCNLIVGLKEAITAIQLLINFLEELTMTYIKLSFQWLLEGVLSVLDDDRA